MTQVLVTKPGVLTAADKRMLRKAGVVPVEAESPEEVRLLQTEGPALGCDDLLFAAITAISRDRFSSNTTDMFAKLLAHHMEQRRAGADTDG